MSWTYIKLDTCVLGYTQSQANEHMMVNINVVNGTARVQYMLFGPLPVYFTKNEIAVIKGLEGRSVDVDLRATLYDVCKLPLFNALMASVECVDE